MINTFNLSPFKRMCITIGNLPSSFMESMSCYEALEWLYNYIDKNIIPAINTEGEAITELQNAFNTLKNYVDNYFENLDVQTEINNKLDEMAESGELTDIIAQYLELAGVLAYNTVNDMVNAENLTNGSICKTTGFYNYNDGGGAFYKIRNITNEDTINSLDLFKIENSNVLVAELISDYNNVLCYGVDENDNNNSNHTIIEYVLNKTKYAYCNKDIVLNNSLTINTNNSKFNFLNISYTGNSYAIIINKDRIELNGVSLTSSYDGIKIGGNNLIADSNIKINNIVAENNGVEIGGNYGVLNSYMNIGQITYKLHGLLFNLENNYVGQIALYNTHFNDNGNGTDNYAIYMDTSNYSMTGLDLYNISFESTNGGLYVYSTSNIKFLEHLNIYECRCAEMSTLHNKKLLKFVTTNNPNNISVIGQIDFDKIKPSSIDVSDFKSISNQSLILNGMFYDENYTNDLGYPYLATSGYINYDRLILNEPYKKYNLLTVSDATPHLINAKNVVLRGNLQTANLVFKTTNFSYSGLYMIYGFSNSIHLQISKEDGTLVKDLGSLASGNVMILYINPTASDSDIQAISYKIDTSNQFTIN